MFYHDFFNARYDFGSRISMPPAFVWWVAVEIFGDSKTVKVLERCRESYLQPSRIYRHNQGTCGTEYIRGTDVRCADFS
jgi:hypothetical protein